MSATLKKRADAEILLEDLEVQGSYVPVAVDITRYESCRIVRLSNPALDAEKICTIDEEIRIEVSPPRENQSGVDRSSLGA